MSDDAARVMTDAFRSAGLEPSQDGNAISVAGKKILVEAGINNRAKKDGQHILAVEFHLNIDGAPAAPLTSGVVGIDANQEATRKTAIFEWAAQYGAPIAYAIAGQLGAGKPPRSDAGVARLHESYSMAGLTVHTGPTGLRGRAKDPAVVSSEAYSRKIAGLVDPYLRGAQPFRSATIQVVVQGTQVVDGECRVNGIVSAALLAALKKLTWPGAAPSYMYKKFFVVAGSSP